MTGAVVVRRIIAAFALAVAWSGALGAPASAATLPTNVTATRGSGDLVTVTWTPGAAGATYAVQAFREATGSAEWSVCAGPLDATTCSDPLNVPRDVEAWIAVSATDSSTVTTDRVRLLAVPAAPSTPTLTAGDTSLGITWTWAASGANVAATGFVATAYSSVAGGTVLGTCSAGAAARTCDIGGLANGSTVFIDVVAQGATGNSDPSARAAGTPVGRPAAPTVTAVEGSDQSLSIRWSAGATNGSAITGYRADVFTQSSGGTSVNSCTTTSAQECSVGSLTNGTSYYAEVIATNALGDSGASARVAGTPGTRATAPRSVAVLRGDRELAVSWLAPTSDGGSEITSYTASAYPSTLSSATAVATCTSSSLSCTLGGVANDTTYYVSVTATTVVGTGSAASRVTVRGVTAMSAPQGVDAATGNGFAKVTWRAPASSGGRRIDGYVVRAYREATGGEAVAQCVPTGATLTCNVGPLPNGSAYYVDVVALTALGSSPASEPRVRTFPSTQPTAPRNVTAVQEGVDVRVRWSVPHADGGHPIAKYVATAFSAATGTKSVGACVTNGDTCLISGVTGPPVYVSVVASNAVGDSPASAQRVKVAITGLPSAPRDVAVERRGASMRVSWLRATNDGGSPITAYHVVVKDSAGVAQAACEVTKPGDLSTPSSCAFRAVPASWTSVTVSAVNAFGRASADPVPVPSKAGLPATPRGLAVLPSERALVASAVRGADHGDTTHYEFRVWSQPTKGRILGSCDTVRGASEPSCRVEGLDNYEPVWVDAVARRGAKVSAPTSRSRAVPMASTPSAVRKVTVSSSPGSVTVRWHEPLSDGGYAVTKTSVTAVDAAGGATLGTCSAKAPKRTCSFEGLTGEYAVFTVTAENLVGPGTASEPVGRNLLVR